MPQSFDDFGKYGREFTDTGLKSFASLSTGAQTIAVEAGEYMKKSLEAGAVVVEKLLSAQSFENALDIQADYARQSYQGFVAEATKLGELYAELASDIYKPFESTVAKAS
ncbi:phasin family protein [Manganibacter manganicus]|uniref:Phasin n=1 Tax=Manganibacter manganicus TaxID=1873176 RepID=A0A1V8RJC5_9HYPH|nr:phasin family protein [Pseudaminobacter manganicus]OQM73206.1 Phasin [Pseudaminobacter manganicus]